MPELPEVESVKLGLQKYLVGHRIEDLQINYQRMFTGESGDIKGGKVINIRRFGKVLSADLDNGNSLVIHIKMTGQLIYRGPNLTNPPQLSEKVKGGIAGKHTHAIFKLDKGGMLYFNDVRKFGWIRVVKSDKLEEISLLGKMGPEPFKDLSLEIFSEIISSTTRPIKTVLMDQAKIAGVGNIYANDALLLAKIYPSRSGKSLTPLEAKKLYDAILAVLKKGINAGGASENAFVTPDGTEGSYQDISLAYGRDGELCLQCKKGVLEKYKLGGRGTYFCPICQKE